MAEEYKGFAIVDTGYSTMAEDGEDYVKRPVYIIRGLKERLGSPMLTSVGECRAFIEDELRAREEADEAMGATWDCRIRSNGNASVVTVPADVMRRLGLEIGDQVTVRIARRRGGSGGREGKFVERTAPAPLEQENQRGDDDGGGIWNPSVCIYQSIYQTFSKARRPRGLTEGMGQGEARPKNRRETRAAPPRSVCLQTEEAVQ